MLRSDAFLASGRTISSNIHSINVDVISKIQKELDACDIISLVFILFEASETTLQRLVVYQRVSKGVGDDLNLLCEWARYAQSRCNWKQEFLEALTVCQLYSIIKKLGFHVPTVKKHFLYNNISTSLHIQPITKVLYKICESVDSVILKKLKKILSMYKINTMDYESCELVFLKLISERFIVVNQHNSDDIYVEPLAEIIEKFPTLKEFAEYLREEQNRLNSRPEKATSTPNKQCLNAKTQKYNNGEYSGNFDDIYELITDLNELNLDELNSDSLKHEIKLKGVYPIKNSKRVGVCLIVNQENLSHSDSFDSKKHYESFEDKIRISKDREILEKTMTSLNFNVISLNDLKFNEIIQSVKDILEEAINPNDSVFMLCILSADFITYKVEDIQNLLDSSSNTLHNIPKVLIIQALHVNSQKHEPNLLVDAPTKTEFYLKKSEFLIFWAPKYRSNGKDKLDEGGSVVIQILCQVILNKYRSEHLNDIFTEVNHLVKIHFNNIVKNQMSIFQSTLTRKLYLARPPNVNY